MGVSFMGSPFDAEDLKNLDAMTNRMMLQDIRQQRTPLLEEADHKIWTLEDKGSDASAWKAYRVKLRDMMAGIDVNNPTWPTKPT